MLSKCLTYLSVVVFLWACVSCLAIKAATNYEGDEINTDPTPKYILKCFWDRYDCSILEILPDKPLDDDKNVVNEENELNVDKVEKRSQLVEKEHIPASHVHLQKLIKRIFPTDSQLTSRLYKTEQVNCLTGDCSLLTARITKRKNNLGTLACIGDPYSSSGSRCLPIEGLYIG